MPNDKVSCNENVIAVLKKEKGKGSLLSKILAKRKVIIKKR